MSHRRNHRQNEMRIERANLQTELAVVEREATVIFAITQQFARELPHTIGLLVPGAFVHDQEYFGEHGPVDSGQSFQIAISVPEGLGCCLWDTEEWASYDLAPKEREAVAYRKFIPYKDLPLVVQLKLLRFTGPVLTRLLDMTSQSS
jgi:hypothetical protein